MQLQRHIPRRQRKKQISTANLGNMQTSEFFNKVKDKANIKGKCGVCETKTSAEVADHQHYSIQETS